MQDVQESKPQVSIDEFRHAIDAALETGELAPVEMTIRHFHTDDLYGRYVTIPAGSIFTTYVHKADHISIALQGHITIVDQDGSEVEVRGPDAFVTKAGTQRVVYVHEAITFMTVHHCTEQDDEKIKNVLGFETMKEYEECKLLEAIV